MSIVCIRIYFFGKNTMGWNSPYFHSYTAASRANARCSEIHAQTGAQAISCFLKVGKNKVGNKIYSATSFQSYNYVRDHILFLHALTGCDTTSALFGKGKKSIFKTIDTKLKKGDRSLLDALRTLKSPNADRSDILRSGIKLFLTIYNAPKHITSLDEFRYQLFSRAVTKKRAANLASLPPTEDAASQHILRSYLQTQLWLNNNLNPQEWGWKLKEYLVPVMMTKEPAPQELLKLIFCNCKKGCGKNCSCKKAGLFCTLACGSCQMSGNCSNLLLLTENEEDESLDYDELVNVNEEKCDTDNEED